MEKVDPVTIDELFTVFVFKMGIRERTVPKGDVSSTNRQIAVRTSYIILSNSLNFFKV